jgi:Rrf2 family protein
LGISHGQDCDIRNKRATGTQREPQPAAVARDRFDVVAHQFKRPGCPLLQCCVEQMLQIGTVQLARHEGALVDHHLCPALKPIQEIAWGILECAHASCRHIQLKGGIGSRVGQARTKGAAALDQADVRAGRCLPQQVQRNQCATESGAGARGTDAVEQGKIRRPRRDHARRASGHGDWVQTPEVAEQERIPRKFLEAILVQLRDHGIVESRRGSHGGHRLAHDPSKISVADIIRIFDGPLALTPCASVTRFRPCTDCVDIESCRLQHLMREARDAVAEVLENCSLATLAAPRKRQAKSRTTRATISARRS